MSTLSTNVRYVPTRDQHVTPDAIVSLSDPDYMRIRGDITPDAMTAVLHTVLTFDELPDSARRYLVARAESALPTMAADAPMRAAGVMLQWLRHCSGNRVTVRDIAEMMTRADSPVILSTDEQATVSLLCTLPGLVDSSPARDPAPRVLSTTRGHQTALDGTYRTFRAHMPVTGDVRVMGGLTHDAHELTNRANDILRAASADGLLGEYALIGTQDMAPPQSVQYSPVAAQTLAGDWLLIDGTPATPAQIPSARVPSGLAVRGHSSHVAMGKPHAVAYPSPRGMASVRTDSKGKRVQYPHRSETHPTITLLDCTNGVPASRRFTVEHYATRSGGRTIIGHGTWTTPTKRTNEPTTKAGRLSRSKLSRFVALEEVHAANAPAHALALAVELHSQTSASEQSTGTTEPAIHASAKLNAEFRTSTGDVIKVGAQHGKRYNVTVKRADGRTVRTSTTAPQYVGAVVANALR